MLLNFQFVTYNEIESTCNEMAKSAAGNRDWVPALWKEEVESLRNLVVDKVLPFLHKVNAVNHDAYIHVVYTLPNDARRCAACGRDADSLLKCSGVSLNFLIYYFTLKLGCKLLTIPLVTLLGSGASVCISAIRNARRVDGQVISLHARSLRSLIRSGWRGSTF
jgi:hypothetical protein